MACLKQTLAIADTEFLLTALEIDMNSSCHPIKILRTATIFAIFVYSMIWQRTCDRLFLKSHSIRIYIKDTLIPFLFRRPYVLLFDPSSEPR